MDPWMLPVPNPKYAFDLISSATAGFGLKYSSILLASILIIDLRTERLPRSFRSFGSFFPDPVCYDILTIGQGEAVRHGGKGKEVRREEAGKKLFFRGVVLVTGVPMWFMPVPEGLKPEAWRLFAVFFTTILSIIVGLLPILVASVLALSVTVLGVWAMRRARALPFQVKL
ncbi:anion permease [Hydrogenimonas sp.]